MNNQTLQNDENNGREMTEKELESALRSLWLGDKALKITFACNEPP
jgi:hypothetical protein